MKKILLLLFLVFGSATVMLAQRTVNGVVSDVGGEPLIGASVVATNDATVGTITDIDGSFSLDVPDGTTSLEVSYTGYGTQIIDITSDDNFDIQLTEGELIDEVVVTALGIKRDEKSLGYSVQELGGENLNRTQSSNIVSNLAGNVAGVQVLSGAGSSVGGSAKVRIRGVNGLSSGDPLYVVDGTPISNANFSGSTSGSDFGNLASDINPEDVEKISVLKGPSATALYGNRAKNGVVLITLKKGAKSKGFGVTASTSVAWDKVYILPEYQNEYAGGYSQSFIDVVDPADGKTYKTLNYSADESWGPKIDGTQYRPWYSWFSGADYGKTIPLAANPNNVRDFFNTGLTNQNSFSVNGGGDKTAFRISYANFNQKGVFPNSKFVKNSVGLSGSYDLTDRLKVSADLNILSNSGRARPVFGYAGKNPATSFNQWFQRQLDIDKLRDYESADGIMKSWNIRSASNTRPLYWDNPFYIQYNSYSTDARSRYYGNLGTSYKLTDEITLRGAVRRDDYSQVVENRNGSKSLDPSSYSKLSATGREDNFEVAADYSSRITDDMTLDINVGANKRINNYNQTFGATAGGLNTPDLFTLKASVDRPTLTSYESQKIVNSVYGAVNWGYRDFLYLGATVRNDWSSALPKDNNSYLYPSLSMSLVFTELMSNNSILSYGKLRGSWAKVGSDLSPYEINKTYVIGNPYGSVPTMFEPGVLANPNLKPALSSSYEVGADLKFLNDRFGIDVTYYVQNSKDEILRLDVPGTTGYGNVLVNAGLFKSSGWELALNANPVRTEKFNWDMSFNFARNRSEIKELYKDLKTYKLADAIGGNRWGGLTVNANVGEQWGTFNGNGFVYKDGKRVIGKDGRFAREKKNLGSVLPDFTGGFRTSVSYGNIDLSAMVDFQVGGKFFSVSKMFNAYSGLGIETVGNNDKGNPVRNPVSEGGGVFVEGVLEDGTPYSTNVPASTYYGRLFGLHENWIYDATYVKWRELSVGYTLPTSLLNGKLRRLRVAAIVKNPLLIYSTVDGIDPSEILPGSNNIAFEERGGLPGTRSFGIKLDVAL